MSESRLKLRRHPLHSAVERCIDRGVTETYDYRAFFPAWNTPTLSYRTIVRDLFKIDDAQLEVFIEDQGPTVEFYEHLSLLRKLDNAHFSKKLFRFLLTLPTREYEITANSMRPSKSTGSGNVFSKSLSNFEYDCSEIKNDEIASTINDTIVLASDEDIIKGICDFAFGKYKSIHREDSYEDDYVSAFRYNLIEPICYLSKKILKKDILVKKTIEVNHDVTYRVETDITIYRDHQIYNHQIFSVVEVKKYPILPSHMDPNCMDGIGPSIFKDAKIKHFMRQLISEMVFFKTDMGILTDSYVAIFVEIDLDHFEENEESLLESSRSREARIIPLRHKVLNCHSSAPTLREALLWFFHKAVVDEHKMELKMDGMDRLLAYLRKSTSKFEGDLSNDDVSMTTESSRQSRPSSSGTNLSSHLDQIAEENEAEEEEVADQERIELPADSDTYLQFGQYYNTQVAKVDARYLKKYLINDMDDNEKLVVKIYDPLMANIKHDNRIYTKSGILDMCITSYNDERMFFQILSKDARFNSCYVPAKRGTIKVVVGYYISRGLFNLFRYIDTVPLRQDHETYMKAKEQVEAMHSHVIYHGDIKEQNILFSREGKVYIIDFAYARLMEKGDNLLEHFNTDMNYLRDVFSEVFK